MPAEVRIVGYYDEKQVVTTQRYCTTRAVDPGLAYPCNQPPSGETYYSYWLYTGAEITGGSFSQCTYWRWYTPGPAMKIDWQMGAGSIQVALRNAGDHGIAPADALAAPSNGEEGLTGYAFDDALNGIPFYIGQSKADASNYTSASPLLFDNEVYTEPGLTKAVCHQFVLKDDTAFGEKGVQVYGIRWREI